MLDRVDSETRERQLPQQRLHKIRFANSRAPYYSHHFRSHPKACLAFSFSTLLLDPARHHFKKALLIFRFRVEVEVLRRLFLRFSVVHSLILGVWNNPTVNSENLHVNGL